METTSNSPLKKGPEKLRTEEELRISIFFKRSKNQQLDEEEMALFLRELAEDAQERKELYHKPRFPTQ